jgi:hypothetical protein
MSAGAGFSIESSVLAELVVGQVHQDAGCALEVKLHAEYCADDLGGYS